MPIGRFSKPKETFPDATVCASGDLMSPEAIKQMFEETGVDAAMIARGSIGNPFIFNQTKELMTTGSYHVESDRQRVQVAHQHLTLMYHYRGERYTTNEIKSTLPNTCVATRSLPTIVKPLCLPPATKRCSPF